MSRVIRLGDEGEHVRVHQRHLNARLKARGARPVPVNGQAGPKLIDRTAFAAWFLGALLENVRKVQGGTISAGVQELIADPDGREPAQLRRARERRGKEFPAATARFRIVTCEEWGAVAPAGRITRVGRPTGIVFHHTDGHCPNLDGKPGDSLEEAKAYARSIQRDHMHRNPPFIDSGHNFLVTRSGHILEGRHGSLAAIKAGVMVASAHAVGANGNPGIEHEHKGGEAMTPIQREASLFLHELICRKTGVRPSDIQPHRKFDATECPGALLPALPQFRRDLARRLAS